MTELTLSDMIRSGQTSNQLTEARLKKIQDEMLEEPCEKCGAPTREAGPLFAMNDKDEQGRSIVLMVCAKCSKQKKSSIRKKK